MMMMTMMIPRIIYFSSSIIRWACLLWMFPAIVTLLLAPVMSSALLTSSTSSTSGGGGWNLPSHSANKKNHLLHPTSHIITSTCTTTGTTSFSSSSSSSSCWGTPPSDSDSSEILDVDFERVVVEESSASSSSSSSSSSFPPSASFESLGDDDDEDDLKKNLLDLSLDADPRWKTARIPFCRGDEYIDAKLAFMVELEGVQYGIAVPFDDAVAIIVQEGGGRKKGGDKNKEQDELSVTYVDPDAYYDNEEYQELMEIMAAQVQRELGEEFMLRKTPKVLTISGDLSQITGKWEKELFGQPASVEELLKSTETNDATIDDEVADFMAFMKAELGEEEFEKTMKEEPSDADRDLMKFFDVAGLGTKKDDMAAFEELIKSMEDDLDETKGVRAQAKEMAPDTDGLSLKLISFDFASGDKSYSLVKLLQPYVLVGKYCEEEQVVDGERSAATSAGGRGDIRFDLLTKDEERILIPKLENLCKQDLEKAGLSLGVKSRSD